MATTRTTKPQAKQNPKNTRERYQELVEQAYAEYGAAKILNDILSGAKMEGMRGKAVDVLKEISAGCMERGDLLMKEAGRVLNALRRAGL